MILDALGREVLVGSFLAWSTREGTISVVLVEELTPSKDSILDTIRVTAMQSQWVYNTARGPAVRELLCARRRSIEDPHSKVIVLDDFAVPEKMRTLLSEYSMAHRGR